MLRDDKGQDSYIRQRFHAWHCLDIVNDVALLEGKFVLPASFVVVYGPNSLHQTIRYSIYLQSRIIAYTAWGTCTIRVRL